MSKIRNLFRVLSGQPTVHIANNGNPIDEVVIRYKDFYFGIDIDVESGEPTGQFGWSKDPLMFHTALREHYIATKETEEE